MNASATAASIRKQLEERGIPMGAVAARLGIDRGHLHRILHDQRSASPEMLRSMAVLAASMPQRARRHHEDAARLIEAATHTFFLKRGVFESAICGGLCRGRAVDEEDSL